MRREGLEGLKYLVPQLQEQRFGRDCKQTELLGTRKRQIDRAGYGKEVRHIVCLICQIRASDASISVPEKTHRPFPLGDFMYLIASLGKTDEDNLSAFAGYGRLTFGAVVK
ncbi:hypothetical protein PM082_019776 [Marasmius tenuissimus]|nr:hypothetical protein PM082_019776 [Marasmius tenuissimus]